MVTTTWSWAETCCLWWARRRTPKTVETLLYQPWKQSSVCLETRGSNGWRCPHPTDLDKLCRLSDSARVTMVQNSSWFGVCIATIYIVWHSNFSVCVALLRRHILTFSGLAGWPDTTVSCVLPVPVPCSHETPLREQVIPCSCSLKSLGNSHY